MTVSGGCAGCRRPLARWLRTRHAHEACHACCLYASVYASPPLCLPVSPHAPGALASNLSKLHAAKRAFNRHKPQAVLYIDRLDAGRRDLADLNVSWLLLCC